MKQIKEDIVKWRENNFFCGMDIQKKWDNINGKKNQFSRYQMEVLKEEIKNMVSSYKKLYKGMTSKIRRKETE